MPVKAHRMECLVIDFENQSTENTIITLQNNRHLHVKVLDTKTIEIESKSYDEHPLNKRATTNDQIRDMFTLPPDGRTYIDRPLRPDTELEAENKKLKYENEQLRAALRLINAESGRLLGK